MKKKLLSVITGIAIFAGVFAGCAAKNDSKNITSASPTPAATAAAEKK